MAESGRGYYLGRRGDRSTRFAGKWGLRMTSHDDVLICRTCAVEHAAGATVCAICSDDRQYIPKGGQQWTSLREMQQEGFRVEIETLEPDLHAIVSHPKAGIGQQAKLLCTPEGNLLWDPIGYVDVAAVRRIRDFGKVRGIVASHPHMFGVQVAWSHALGDVPVWVADVDKHWIARADPVIKFWTDDFDILPGVKLVQVGGHFPGSAVVHWSGSSDGKGVLLGSDTIFANPDRASVSFMRSYPNRFPLSAAVVERIAHSVCRFSFDRLYGNFDNAIENNAKEVVRASADRHIAWISGQFDDLT